QQEREDQRRHHRAGRPERDVTEQVEDDVIFCQWRQQVVEHTSLSPGGGRRLVPGPRPILEARGTAPSAPVLLEPREQPLQRDAPRTLEQYDFPTAEPPRERRVCIQRVVDCDEPVPEAVGQRLEGG